MIGLVFLLVSGAASIAIVMRCKSTGAARGEKALADSLAQVHIPVWIALVAMGGALGSDPVIHAVIAHQQVNPGSQAVNVWVLLGLPVLVALASFAQMLLKTGESARGGASCVWVAGAALVCLMVMADRVHFFEAQLMILGALTLIWWRSAALDDHTGGNTPSAIASTVGLYVCAVAVAIGAGWAMADSHVHVVVPWVLFGLSLGIAGFAPGCGRWILPLAATGTTGGIIVTRAVMLAFVEVRQGVDGSLESWISALAGTIGSMPYLSGLGTLAPEATALLVLSVCGAGLQMWGGGEKRQITRILGVTALFGACGMGIVRLIW